jgi:hypothetical protein
VINNKDGKAVEKIMKMTDDQDGALRRMDPKHLVTGQLLIFCGCRHDTRTANTAALIS